MTDPARHQVLREKLVDLAIDALAPAEAREVEVHAAGCPECRAELASLRGVREAVRDLPPLPAPDRGEAVLLAAARQAADEAREARRPRLPAWLWGAALGGAGVAAMAVLAVKLTSGAPGPMDQEVAAPAAVTAPAEAAPAPSAPPLASARPAPQAEERKSFSQPPPPARIAAQSAAPTPSPTPSTPASPPAPPSLSPAPIPIPTPAPKAAAPRSAALTAKEDALAAPAADTALALREEAAPPNGGAATSAGASAPSSLGRLRDAAPAAEPERRVAAKRAAAPPAEAQAAPPATAPEETRADPACPAEQRRTLWRDSQGRLIRRLRLGQLQGVAVLVDERFAPDGRIESARLEWAGRTALLGRAGLEAAAFLPPPGLRVAATAAEAEAAPPACQAWPR